MTKEVITISKEDYLKAILEAESEGQTVISSTWPIGYLFLLPQLRWP